MLCMYVLLLICVIFSTFYMTVTLMLPLYSTNRHLHLRLVRIMKPDSGFELNFLLLNLHIAIPVIKRRCFINQGNELQP